MALFYPAVREVPAGTAMVLISLVPLLTFGFAILHGQEHFHVQGLIGALIALGGVALIIADQLDAAVPLVSMLLILVGVAFIAESSPWPFHILALRRRCRGRQRSSQVSCSGCIWRGRAKAIAFADRSAR